MNFKEQEKTEIRFSGTGGQGLVLASIILAEALMMDSFNIITGESHGIEARGGASSAEIIASKKEIFDLSVTLPDILVVISQQAYDKYGKKIKKDTLVILDSSLIKSESIPDSENVHAFPFSHKISPFSKPNVSFLTRLR